MFDNLLDSEENLLRNNSSTVPVMPLQNRFSPLVESPNVRETVIEGSENLHVSSEDEFQERPNSGRQVVPRIDRTLHSVADNLPGVHDSTEGTSNVRRLEGSRCDGHS